MLLLKKTKVADPFAKDLFQKSGIHMLTLRGVNLNSAWNMRTKFEADELRQVHEAERAMKKKVNGLHISIRNLEKMLENTCDPAIQASYRSRIQEKEQAIGALSTNPMNLVFEYTEKPPIHYSHIVAVMGAILRSKKTNGEPHLNEINAIINDYKGLADNQLGGNTHFLNMAVADVANEIDLIKTSSLNFGIVEKKDVKTVNDYNKLISDLSALLASMNENGKNNLMIYKKIEVDIDFLKAMYDFIIERYDSVQKKINKLNIQIARWEKLSGKIASAIEQAVPSPKSSDIKKYVKMLGGAIVIGGTSAFALWLKNASETTMGLFVPIATMVGAIIMPTAIEILKIIPNAIFNLIINKKTNKIEKLETKEKRIVLLQTAKLMGVTGYWMDIKGLIPEKIRAAVFQGDFDTLNNYYYRKKAELENGRFRAVFKLAPGGNLEQLDQQLSYDFRTPVVPETK